jgi:hypothetical protein
MYLKLLSIPSHELLFQRDGKPFLHEAQAQDCNNKSTHPYNLYLLKVLPHPILTPIFAIRANT